MNNWNALLQLISLLILSIVGLFLFISIPKKVDPALEEQERSLGWCGTVMPSYPKFGDSETVNPYLGKELFKENCSTCHSKNMVSSAIGPPLAEAWKNFNKDTVQYFQYLTNREAYLTSYNDKRILKLYEEYGFVQKPNFSTLTMDDIKSLIMYIHFTTP